MLDDFADRDHLGCRPGQEDLVCIKKLVKLEDFFFDGETQCWAQGVFDESAGDAFEDTDLGRRGEDLAILDDEDVIARAFSDLAIGGEHDALEELVFGLGDAELFAQVDRFTLGHDVVEVVEGLNAWIKTGDRCLWTIRKNDPHARFVHLRGEERDGIGDTDHASLWALVGVEPKGALATGDDQADVAVGDVVGCDAFALDADHFLTGDSDIEEDLVGTVIEAIHVLFELEDLAIVDTDAFEDPVAIEESMIEYRDCRL